MSAYENTNLNDLKRNIINVSCECDIGYRYIAKARECVDIDECLENGKNVCAVQGKMCLNTLGSYVCVCAQGFIADNLWNFQYSQENKSLLQIYNKTKCISEKQFYNRQKLD